MKVYEIRYWDEDYDDGRGAWRAWDDELYLHEAYAQSVVDRLNAEALARHNETEEQRRVQFAREAAKHKVLVDAGFEGPSAFYDEGYQRREFKPRYAVYDHDVDTTEVS